MSLSDFGAAAAGERQRLLGALVQQLAGAQPDSERHRQLLGAALETVTHHRFGDADPRVVDELLDRLSDRFGEHAQFRKQRALQLLRAHLHQAPVQSSQYEFQHRLLAFLYAAARSPLGAAYPGGELVDSLEAQARTAVAGPPTYLSDASSDGGSWVDDLGAYSPSSQLSDWSDVAGQPGGEGGATEAAAEAHERAAAAAAADGSSAAQQAVGGRAASPPPRAPPSPDAPLARLFPQASRAAPRRDTPYSRTSLSVWLASKASGGQPARVLQPALCFHEAELLQQTIHMLQGVAAPGPAFQLDHLRGTYAPCPGVHRATSSQGSLRDLLARLCGTASALRRVRAFCAAAGGGGSGGQGEDPEEARLLRLPTVVAFAAAVGEQLQAAERQVLVLQSALDARALLSLQQLQQRTACLAEQAALLDGLVRRCCAWRGSAADTAAGLLTALYQALQLQLLQARSQGGVLAAMALRVFTASCRPLLAALHAWLYRGVLDDPHQEFFVQAAPGAAVPTDSPRFWSEAFTLRPAGGASAAAAAAPGGAGPPAAAPCFLAPLADAILSAGKSALLLQAYSAWRLAAAAAATGQRSAGGSGSAGQGRDGAIEGPPSPAKRRLSELGALGFTTSDAQHGQPYGVPQPQPAAAAASLAWLCEAAPGAGAGDGPGPEPLALHQQLLLNLEAQLRDQLSLTAGAQLEGAQVTGVEAMVQQQQQQEDACAAAGSTARSSRSDSSTSSEQELAREWLAAAAACNAHTLQLPPQDTLPPLPAVPASADALPAAYTAVIPPADAAAAGGCGSGAAPGSSAGAEPSVAERMRQAAAARAAQATRAAAEQLPDLLIPPAPLEALSAGARGEAAAGVPGRAAAGAAQPPEAAAAQFESGAWQEWYCQTAAALSQQLHVLDCLGGSGGGGGGSQRQLLNSYGVPLALPPYAGSVCDQLWGRRPRGGQAAAALEPSAAAEAPPLDVLLQHSLLRPVRAQLEAAGGELCTALLRHGLLRQLGALRDTYLLSSQPLQPFVSFLLHRISNVGGLDRLSEFEANAALQDALAAGGRSTPLRCSLHILPAPPPAPAQAAAGALPPRVHALARLRLRVEPGWPLALVVGEDMLAQYNAVLVLLLQLRWVKQSLQAVRYQGWKAGRRASQRAAARDWLQHQMTHLVDAVLQYVTDRVVAASAWLEQALEACTSLDDMHRCRAKYQRAVARYCLLSTEGVARLVHEGLLHLLNACLQYCALQRQLSATSAALDALDAGGAADGSAADAAARQAAGEAGDAGEAGGAAEGAAVPPPRAGPAGVQWAGRRGELARRRGEVQAALGRLRRDWASRQRLLVRVLSTKAAEAGSHADELRQLLGALDYSRHYEAGLA